MLTLLFNPLFLLLGLGLAVWYLRRHRDDPPPAPGQGRRWRRGLALGVLVLFVGGTGLCGVTGTLFGLTAVFAGGAEAAYGWMFVLVGGVGVVFATAVWWAVRRAIRPSAPATAAATPTAAAAPAADAYDPFDGSPPAAP